MPKMMLEFKKKKNDVKNIFTIYKSFEIGTMSW